MFEIGTEFHKRDVGKARDMHCYVFGVWTLSHTPHTIYHCLLPSIWFCWDLNRIVCWRNSSLVTDRALPLNVTYKKRFDMKYTVFVSLEILGPDR